MQSSQAHPPDEQQHPPSSQQAQGHSHAHDWAAAFTPPAGPAYPKIEPAVRVMAATVER